MFGILRDGNRRRHERYNRWFASLPVEKQEEQIKLREARDEAFISGVITGLLFGIVLGIAGAMAVLGK